MIFNSLLDRPLAKTLWDYQLLKHPLKKADFLLLVCSYNLEVADYVDVLSMQKMAKTIIVSGGSKDRQGMARLKWDKPEHIIFTNRLMELGGDKNNIIVENKAMTLCQSIQNSRAKLLEEPDILYSTGLIALPPHCERRAFATAQKEWPEIDWQVTSPNVTYDDYIKQYDEENLIHLLVGEVQRTINYGDKGYIIKQDVPEEVMSAYQKLLDKGYTKRLIKED